MLVDLIKQLSVRDRIDLNGFQGSPERNHFAVRTQIRCEHDVAFVADRSYAFPRSHIVKNNDAGLNAAAASGQQGFSIPAEAQNKRNSLREGERAEGHLRSHIVKIDTFVSRYRENRSQWAGRKSSNRTRPHDP